MEAFENFLKFLHFSSKFSNKVKPRRVSARLTLQQVFVHKIFVGLFHLSQIVQTILQLEGHLLLLGHSPIDASLGV